MSKVYLQQATKPENIHVLLERMKPDISNGRVLIKPNIVAPFDPSTGIVTHPDVVRGFIEYFRSRGIRDITIGETPGLGVNVEMAFRVSGFRKLAEEMNIDLVDLNNEEVVDLPWAWGSIKIPKIVTESFYVNISKLKTHVNTTVSLGLKNQKGLIATDLKKLMHREGLHSPIVDLAGVVRPNLSIIDGIIGIQGDGPCGQGEKIKSNVLIASSDILAADAVGCRVMGIDPIDVEHIRLASEAGIGEINPEICGDELEKVRIIFKRANEKCRRIFQYTVWRNPQACSMCGSNLSAAIRRIATTPRLAITIGPKFAYRFLLGGINVLSGRCASVPVRPNGIICLGKCTKELAAKHHFEWVTGCPPEEKDIINGFRRL